MNSIEKPYRADRIPSLRCRPEKSERAEMDGSIRDASFVTP